MTRLARRAALFVTLSLLTSAATASAECAWVMWIRASPVVKGTIVGAWTPWITYGATTEDGGCESLEPRDGTKRKRAFEATGLVLKSGQAANLVWQCLPDTVDPRGVKGR